MAATRSLTRAVVVFIAATLAVTGVFTVTPEPARAATFTVSTTADAGAGSLRQAILDANLAAGVDAIDFSIPGTGPHTIALSAALPTVDEALTIDASNELIGSAPGVILDGAATIEADGLVISNPLGNGIVIGLQIVNFDGAGIRVDGSDAASIRGNRIGTDGTADLGNGIGVAIQDSFDVVVGGTDPADANVIAENDDDGVQIAASANSVSVRGNSIRDSEGLGIDIDPEGVGGGLGTPVITSATATSIEGSVDPIDDNLHVEVFANPACDASGSGEGAVLLGTTTADAAGNWSIPAAATNGAHLSATATLVDIGETSTSEFGECFEVVDGLPATGTWVGQKTGGSGASIPGDGDVLAAGSAAAGPAQFTYGAADPVPTSGVGASGSWTFSTTAAADATIQIPWRYTGFHAFAGVTVGLQAFVTGGGNVVTPQPLLAEGPQSCIPVPPDPGCPEPSGGFDYAGVVEFAVQAGDTYGFNLSGSNGDTNASLRGELVLGTELPTDCTGAQALYAAEDDGRYVILPSGGQRFSVHCADMNAAALDYLELHPEVTGPGFNFSSYAAGGASPGTTVSTAFTKVRFDPATLLVDVDDRAFSTSTGLLTHSSVSDPHPVSSMPYATAMACNSGVANGTANVNLFGTGFIVEDAWTPNGIASSDFDSAIFSAGGTVVDIEGNGFCGWNHPDEAGPLYVFEPNPGRFVLQLGYATDAVQLETPSVFASVSRSATTADIFARVDGAQNTPLDVEVHTSESCNDGVLTSPVLLTTMDVVTDAEGYLHLESVEDIESGDFVTITVTAPDSTSPSSCVRTTADNDYWPKALTVSGGVQDVVEIEGRARWYRFPIVPDQRITVTLSSLPADYDLAVFRDIGDEFESQLIPATANDLTRLSAEFAPSVFSPSVFSPSVFSPSVFSPDAYAPSVFSPSVFSPSVFSPSVFSPSVFSPSVFSPSVFSPSVFSPSVFSPSVFSPSVFSPSVFSPSVFSPEEISQAFSSAQTRSLIGVSATPGTGDETVVVNSWNNTGFFYVRVAGRGGAFDPDDLFTVSVAKSASTCEGVAELADDLEPFDPVPGLTQVDTGMPVETVILTDSSGLPPGSETDPESLQFALDALAAHERVSGVIVDIADAEWADRIAPLRQQVEDNADCPYAVNLLAEELKRIVDLHRASNDIRYVTIIGDDTVIPFFRYPDQSRLGQESQYFPPTASDTTSDASLRRDFVLSQDAYGAGVSIDIRTNVFPIPDLAVGRLVETQAEITNMIDAFLDVDGVVSPGSALVTGYDFLTDAADAVVDELQDGGTTVDELITDADVSPQQLETPSLTDPRRWSWTADDLREALFGERHDVVYLAGHFSTQSALAADYDTSVLTSELASSTVDFRNSLVFSGGCHSGYNLVDGHALATTSPLDWAQAFAREGAVLVGGTGYQYGDTEFLEYSERLYRDFARELRAGQVGTAISVGEALMHAKRTYLATTSDIRGIHEKAILEAAVFGLPMFGVDMPDGRGAIPGTGGGTLDPTEILDGPAADLGLATHDLDFASDNEADSLELDVVEAGGVVTGTVTAQWFNGPSGVVTNPAEPAVPKHITSVTSSDSSQVLRGVGWRGGTYLEEDEILPLTGAPTTELRGVHAPFVSPVFYPMKMWTPNYFGQLSGSGGTNLIVTPVQHKTDTAHPGQTIRREFTDLDLRLFYSSNLTDASLSDAPTIVKVSTAPDGGDIVFRAEVVGDPKAAVHEVWVVWTDGSGTWAPLDLRQCTTEPPAGTLPVDCDGLDDSRVWAGRVSDAPPSIEYVAQAANGVGLVAFDDNRGQYYVASTTPAPEPVATTLTLDAPSGGTYGETAIVNVDLTASGGGPVSDAIVFIKVGGTDAVGITDAFGHASVPVSLNSTPATTRVTASFGGMPGYLPSHASAPFTIAKAPTDFGPLTPFLTTTEIGEGRALTGLTADRAGTAQPLIDTNVTVTLSGATTQILSVKTNYLGEVKLPVAVAPGSYTVTVEFAGDETYEPASESGTVAVVSFAFLAPVDNAPTVNVVKAGSTVPIKFSLGGNHGLGILDGTPRTVRYDCESGVPQDEIELTVTSNSGLSFTGGLYQYSWNTPKGTVGCFEFRLALDDGSTQVALFRLR